MAAPRPSACCHSSSTNIAAPSASTSPLRSFANGLHDAEGPSASSHASVFSASHATRVPNESGASLPPANMISVSPLAMRRAASPMATADDEQAVENVRFGPVNPYSIPIHDAAALVMGISTL